MTDFRRDSFGTELQVGDGASPEVFTCIEELATMPEIPSENSERDRTTLADTSRKIYPGFPNLSKFDVEVAASTAAGSVQASLIAHAIAKTEFNMRAHYPDSPALTYAFTAKVTKWTPPYVKGVDTDAMIKFTIVKTSALTEV